MCLSSEKEPLWKCELIKKLNKILSCNWLLTAVRQDQAERHNTQQRKEWNLMKALFLFKFWNKPSHTKKQHMWLEISQNLLFATEYILYIYAFVLHMQFDIIWFFCWNSLFGFYTAKGQTFAGLLIKCFTSMSRASFKFDLTPGMASDFRCKRNQL